MNEAVDTSSVRDEQDRFISSQRPVVCSNLQWSGFDDLISAVISQWQ